ncbi:MAG: plasmid stabilization protein [Alphaproteobacteria bacterium]|nr:MAG: plasmid stabilization protein [Alphaproteobacteria bacterium]
MTKFNVIVSPRAKRDLKDIYAYTLQSWGEKKADSYLSNIKTSFLQLLDNPKIGRERLDVQSNLRSLHVEKHVIFYKINDSVIYVLGVLHCRMDVMNYFPSSRE